MPHLMDEHDRFVSESYLSVYVALLARRPQEVRVRLDRARRKAVPGEPLRVTATGPRTARVKATPRTEYPCPLCSETFSRGCALGSHKYFAHGVRGRRR